MKRPESVRIFWTDWIQVSKTFSLLAERLFSVAQRDFVVCRFYNHLLKKEGKKEKRTCCICFLDGNVFGFLIFFLFSQKTPFFARPGNVYIWQVKKWWIWMAVGSAFRWSENSYLLEGELEKERKKKAPYDLFPVRVAVIDRLACSDSNIIISF